MFLKNKNIIFKIRRSKVTDYAALIHGFMLVENMTVKSMQHRFYAIIWIKPILSYQGLIIQSSLYMM